MVDPSLPTRRHLLETGGILGMLALAGCVHSNDADDDDGSNGEDAVDGNDNGTGGTSDDPDEGDATDDLDLREANVVDVAFEETDTTYTFEVTLHHDDDGEEGYANWWQVERLDGTQIARRDLLHAHSNQPFTRSETMEISDDVDCVVVRGHDQTHGYGGVAMVVSLESGELNAVDQGSDQQSFDADDCPCPTDVEASVELSSQGHPQTPAPADCAPRSAR